MLLDISPTSGYHRVTFSNGDTDDFKNIEILIGGYADDLNLKPWSQTTTNSIDCNIYGRTGNDILLYSPYPCYVDLEQGLMDLVDYSASPQFF